MCVCMCACVCVCAFLGRLGNKRILASQDDLALPRALEIRLEVRTREAPRELLLNDLFAALGLELAELGGQRRAGGEDRGPVGLFVHNVYQRCGRCAVSLQQGRDGLASGGYVGGLQVTFGISAPDGCKMMYEGTQKVGKGCISFLVCFFLSLVGEEAPGFWGGGEEEGGRGISGWCSLVLRVNDNQDAILGRSCRRLDADKFAETLCHCETFDSCVCVYVFRSVSAFETSKTHMQSIRITSSQVQIVDKVVTSLPRTYLSQNHRRDSEGFGGIGNVALGNGRLACLILEPHSLSSIAAVPMR